MRKIFSAVARPNRLQALVSPALAVVGMLAVPATMVASGRLSLDTPAEQFLAGGLALCAVIVISVGVWRALEVRTQKN